MEVLVPASEPQAAPASLTEQWILANTKSVTGEDLTRILVALGAANIAVDMHFSECQFLHFHGVQNVWTRVELCNFPQGADVEFDEEKLEEAHTFIGIHCTSTTGAIGILHERAMKAGAYGDAAYCRLVQAPTTFQDVIDGVIIKALGASKNSSDVISEVRSRAPSRNTVSNGVYGDMEIAKKGYIAHYHSSKENRWLVPLQHLTIRAVWFCCSSFRKTFDALQSGRVKVY